MTKSGQVSFPPSLPPVLDACCGSRMMWYDRKDSRAIYVDKRRETWQRPPSETHPKGDIIIVDPDMVADFTNLPFPDESFWHVVFDPPHFVRSGEPGFLAKTYGWLGGDWREMLRGGFVECFRVLKPGGTLVFKWTDTDTPLREVLALTPERPLYGHKTGAKARTHWCVFFKAPQYSAWIPVEHSKPETYSSVIVAGILEDEGRPDSHQGYWCGRGWWSVRSCEMNSSKYCRAKLRINCVTHWMRRPKPPGRVAPI